MNNFYNKIPDKFKGNEITYDNYENVKIKLPFRAVIIGASGSGKTNTLMNMIKEINAFDKIYLFAKDLEEPLYAWLIESMKEIEKKLKTNILFYSSSLDDMPDLDNEIDKKYNNLVIWDDMINEPAKQQEKIAEYYIRARKKNCSLVYLSQSYYSIPSKIRKNCNYIIMTKIATTNDLSRIISEYKLDITKEKLLELYNKARESFGNFLLIDIQTNEKDLQYRVNFGPRNTVDCKKTTTECKQEIKILKSAKDLKDEFNIKVSEFNAGNDSRELLNDIVEITDELHRRKLISKKLAKEVMMMMFNHVSL